MTNDQKVKVTRLSRKTIRERARHAAAVGAPLYSSMGTPIDISRHNPSLAAWLITPLRALCGWC